jgi:RNA polymerase sigma-70 factor (ECF subfamily)
MPLVTETRDLLVRWHGGDQAALAELVQQDKDWIDAHVRRRLGPLLRRRNDTQDIVQQTLVEVLRCGPRFVVSDRGHLRGLLARMVENVLRVQANHHQAQKRDLRREQAALAAAATGDSILELDLPAAVTRPDRAAERSETRDWVRLALEFLEADDRNAIVWRDYEDLPFAEIAERLGVAEDAARMRYRRALPKLAKALSSLREGKLDKLL